MFFKSFISYFIALHFFKGTIAAECTVSSDCEFYCTPNQECKDVPKSCVAHSDCEGEFPSGNLPYCKEGTCQDIELSGTCSGALACEELTRVALAENFSVGHMTQVVKSSNLTKTRQASKQLYTDLKANTAVTNDIYAKLSGSESVTLYGTLFLDHDESTILDEIKTILCGNAAEFCTVSKEGGIGRRLQAAEDITVTVTYTIESATYDSIPEGSFDSPEFKSDLAAALNVSESDVEITAVDGQIEIEYIVATESTSDDPLTSEHLDAVTLLQTEISTIESAVVSNLGIDPADIQETIIDKCGDRSCNSRGTCVASTGLCDCTDLDYWGINCETLVGCNDGVKSTRSQYCLCEFPKFGQRCQSIANLGPVSI